MAYYLAKLRGGTLRKQLPKGALRKQRLQDCYKVRVKGILQDRPGGAACVGRWIPWWHHKLWS